MCLGRVKLPSEIEAFDIPSAPYSLVNHQQFRRESIVARKLTFITFIIRSLLL